MLRKLVYPKIEGYINLAAEFLNEQEFSPNQLTLAGMALNFLAGCVYAMGNFFLAGIILVVASLADMLDGPLARVSRRASAFGAFLDSTVDRYSDFFIFGGLALYFARQNQGPWFLIVMGILLGAFVTSYAKARAESLIKECPVGVFERAERIIILAVGSIIWPLWPLCLWILLIGTHATAIQRILYTQKILTRSSPDKDDEG